jgi:hypothetical protein
MATRNTSPVIPATARIGIGALTAANTNRDGTGTIVTLLTGTAEGTVIDRVRIKSIVTTTAGMVRFYLHNGSTAELIKEVVVSAITVAAGTAGFESEWVPDDLILPDASHSLRASIHNPEETNCFVHARDY